MAKKKAKVAQQKSKTPLYALLGVVLVAGLGLIWYTVNGSGKQAPIVLDPDIELPEATGYVLGDTTAPVTIIEYGDFECPGCMQFATMIEPDVRRDIIDKGLASFRYYDFPLTEIHGNTMSASLAASCADEQGKFWQMHDAIFHGFYDWITQATSNPKKVFARYAEGMGLDMQQWNQCFDTQRGLAKVIAHRNSGSARGVTGTPTFIINNAIYDSRGLSSDRFKQIVDSLTALAGQSGQ